MAPTGKRERETEKIQWDQDRLGSTRRVAPGKGDRKTFKLGSYRYGGCPRKKMGGARGTRRKRFGPGSCLCGGCPGNLVEDIGWSKWK